MMVEVTYMYLLYLQGAEYFLRADFVTYNNSLHAYWDPESGSGACCDGNDFPTDCSDPCNTLLEYCFGIISNYQDLNYRCVERVLSSNLILATDYIDYSMPPFTIGYTTTNSFFVLQGDSWLVS